MNPIRRSARLLALAAAAAVVAAGALAACTSGAGSSITVSEPWSRASSAMASAGAAYMTIRNAGPEADALVGAASPVAATVEVHETMAVETPAAPDGMGGGMETPAASDGMGGGMMGMRPVARLEVPAGGAVELKPGGYHIMLIGLKQELKVGDSIEITLTFEKAGDVKVTAEVRAS